MSTIVNIIMYLWQLPQYIAGLVVKVVVRSRTASTKMESISMAGPRGRLMMWE